MELYLYHRLLTDEIIQSVMDGQDTRACRLLLPFAENEAVGADIFREYLIRRIAEDENTYSLGCPKGHGGGTLLGYARRDIDALFPLLDVPLLTGYRRTHENKPSFGSYADSLRQLQDERDIDDFFSLLTAHYARFGCGRLSGYCAFRYRNGLQGIRDYDLITFDKLVGLTHQKETLIANTRAFVNGKKANNVLLSGDSGCGKSSCVKALLPLFQEEGLRLIEFPKNSLSALPELFAYLNTQPHRYILFLDDLSFEHDDLNYKNLKIAMEGQLVPQSENVLLYATSNRRHLLAEYWADREGGEVHVNDTMQEKLSLSERFGIQLVFASPTQQEYLKIVEELLQKENILLTPELSREAIIWEMNYNGRSGRTAKQFVTHILHATS